MKNKLNKLATFIFILALFCSTLNFIPFVGMVSADLAPSVEWSHIYSAGLGDDAAWCVVETLDGGFALGGSTNSFGAGSDDFWLIKTDSEGVEEWNMTYGDSSFERALSLIQTSDGGYALIGYRINSTTYTSDVWFVKTDEYGSMSWNMTYGGAAGDHAYSVIETIDGYAIAGSTYSYGAGNYDVWLIKTDQYGVPQWNQTYGGTTSDEGYSMVMTAEGFAIAGSTRPVGKDYLNALVVRVASNGTLLDLYTYEINTNSTRAYSIVESADGFVLAGVSQNPDNPEIDTDFLLFKTTTTGEILWNQTYDNNVNEMPESLIETTDGGFVLAGYTGVSNTTLDAWVVKTDSAGNELWNQTYGEYLTIGRSIIQTNDGYYALAGHRSVGQGYYADAWLTLLRRARVHNLDTGVDYYSIQDAIDDYQTLDGHTIFVESGTYYENVEIIKSIILIGEDSSTTIIDGGGALDVLAIRSDNVSVSGFTVMDSYGEVGEGGGGLVVSGEVGNIQISDIIARNNNADCGVHLVPGSHDVNITNTIIMDNSRGGLLLHRTQNVTVSNNTITNNNIWAGITLLNDSHNNTISGNTITNNDNGISFQNSSSYNAVYGNTITNCTNTGIRLSESSNNLVSGNTITNNNWGINLVNSQNNTLTDNNMTSNTYNFGVFGNLLEYYIHNIDTSNTVDGKDVYYLINQSSLTIDPENFPNIGFLALVNSTNIAVRDLTLTNNLEGILCVSLTDCTIENVSITDNFLGFTIVDNPPGTSATNNIMSGCSWGVFITNTTSGFSLHDNIISNNNYGIGILGPNNTFVENTIINNEYGVLVQNCSDNIFYHNNFIDNTVQANVTDGYVNTWDNGYPSGGNYWSDYTGVDLYSGPYQDETGSDVIGDTPYIIDLDNQDNYPLMPSLVLGSIYLESIAYGETLPSSDWLYKLTETATANVINFEVPPGNTSLILSDLTPGWYMLNLTSKFNYYTTGITINETAIEWETSDTEISVTLEVLSGETTTVEFSNAWIPDDAWARKVKEDDTSAPSMMTYSLPCLVAIPVQVTWDLEEPIDLVMGKATRILVNLTDLLEPVGPISPNDGVIVTVSITSDSPDFTPMEVTLTGQEIADNNVVIFSPNTPSTLGEYTITCTITADSTPPYSSALVTPVSVKETSTLSLYYTHLSMPSEYGTEPLADFETMVTNSSDFVEATYPVPSVEVYSNETALEGTADLGNFLGLLKDCQNVAKNAKLAFPDSPNAIGVAIGPDLQSGGNYDNYFAYHGAKQGKKTAVGISFGPGVKGVVALDGYYSSVAHEIGHTFDLYYGLGVPEQYEIVTPGISCTGFRADENEWRSGYDFMGLSPYQTTANVWVNRESTFDPLFAGLKTPGDPEILFVQGIIHVDDDGNVTLVELPETWYSMPYGIPDTVPQGEDDRFLIRFTLDNGTVVETSFYTEFLVHICPGVEVGENLPEDFSGFGDVPVDFAGFAFAIEYPGDTDVIEIVDTDIPPEEDQVIATIDDPEEYIESVVQFGGFLLPVEQDGSSTFKRRTVVPVKFQLQSAPGVFVTSAQAKLNVTEIDEEGNPVGDPMAAPSATPYDLFRYDPLKNQYVFNLKTKGMKKGYWRLEVIFEDGTIESVRIRLK